MRWLAAAVAALTLVACSGEDATDQATTTTAAGLPAGPPAEMPVPRTEVAGAALGGRVVVVGGLLADGGTSDRTDIYDPAANAWTAGPALPVPAHHAGAASVGDRLYVAGGYTNGPGEGWRELDQVVSLALGERAWRPEPPLPAGRAALGLAAAAGRLVAFGGVSGGQVVATALALVPGEAGWRPLPEMRGRREHTAAASAGGRVYAIAGRVGGLESNLRTVESIDPTGGGWRGEPELNDTRGGTAAATSDGAPCVAGGEEPAGTIASVECLRGGRWQQVARLAEPRHGLAVVAVGRRLHVVAGGARPGLFVSGTHEVVDP